MTRRSQLAFLALVGVQVLHSIEEYTTHLYDTLAPARFISGLFSEDPALGFAVFNCILIALAAFAYAVPVRRSQPSAVPIAWFLALLEIGNGVAHLGFAAIAGGYFSGALTAPLLIAGGASLATSLRKDRGSRGAGPVTEPRASLP